ncbi:cell filamentation protein Fic [Aerophototrophica crusticola]|uniref:Cell filamentation protein Fic n=1 Tax=Aerophototrophica crusticola TaxID=1709002 RepID=A0A858RAH3_9PROT|nr:cell filamentation protein Fic [Rhodospirillaceae bacterium B3]
MERYGSSYDKGDDPLSDLAFALRYEPLHLGILKAVFRTMGPEPVKAWVRQKPTGKFARRAWFFYEWLMGERLDLPDATAGAMVDALDEDKHVTSMLATPLRRYRVSNNLLGSAAFCPVVRLSRTLRERQVTELGTEVRALVEGCDPAVLARAVQYVLTKETRSSFAIERDEVAGSRAERFIAALRTVQDFDPASEADQTGLQNLIVGDPRYGARGWRGAQIYIGETVLNQADRVRYICPQPEDIRDLMGGFAKMVRGQLGEVEFDRSLSAAFGATIPHPPAMLDPITAAAVISFAFVFIHPFEDGNGRIHRFLIHHVLERLGFTPPGLLFPVSAVILRNRRAYDEALEAFSEAIMPFIDWDWTPGPDGLPTVVVKNDTADLYRYFDATPMVEFLYRCVAEAIRVDLKQEIAFLAKYDRALRALMEVSAMPDRKAGLFTNLVLQNGKVGAEKRRRHFAELTEEEADRLEQVVLSAAREAVADGAAGDGRPAVDITISRSPGPPPPSPPACRR